MTVQELKKLIKENAIPNFLIFTGDEWKVQEVYIKQIAKVKDLSVFHAEDIDEVWKELKARTLFGKDTLYILRDDKELLHNEKIYSKLDDVLKDNMLILQLTSVDKRLRMIKQYNNSIVEFEALNEAILKQYIQKEIALNDRNCEKLMEVTSYNYGHCLLEIDKIKKCMSGTDADDMPNDIFEMMLADGTIYIPPKEALWDFIKVFLQNKPFKAYELYQDLKELNTPTFAILSNLYNNARAIFQVQTCKSDNIEKSTGLTSWQIRNAKECVGRLSNRDLAVLMRLIQKVETDIKTGKLDEEIAIDYIFTSFF